MVRYQLLIEYVGTNFRGWQIQKKGSTIQGLIQEKLSKLLKEKIISIGILIKISNMISIYLKGKMFIIKNLVTEKSSN